MQIGLMGLLKFALICIDFLAWPVIALGYPLFASIRAVETASKYHMRKLVIYWTLFSLISLFEFAFVKIIEWIPFWSSIRLIVIFWLVMPRFDGACHAYQSLVRPVLFVNLEAVIDKLYKPKEEKPRKRETLLDVAEQYIKENGAEALEKLIASKQECKESDNSPRDVQVLEPEENNAAAASKQLKVPDAAQLDNETLEATKKNAATEVKRVQYAESKTTAWFPKGTDAAAKVKETTPSEASVENRRQQTPPLEKPQEEWTCDLCKMTTTCEETLNAHLQGSKHKSKCESLKARKLQAIDTRPSPETPSLGKPQEWTCDLCKVTTTSEKTLNAHLQGSKHKSKCESLEASKLQEKDMGPSPETPPLGKPQEWTCDLCKVTTSSEKMLNDHLQGSKHKSKCESPEASKLQAKDTRPSAETPSLGRPQEWTYDLCKVATTSEKMLNDHQGSKHKSKCESLEASKLQAKDTGPSQETPPIGKPQEWTCDLCKVTTASEKMLNDHLQGSKHKSKCVSVEASKLQAKDTGPSRETPSLGKSQEWTCDLCKVTTASEKMLNDHLQGSKHKSKRESMEASKLQAKDTRPSVETPHIGKPQEWTCDLCKVTTASEKMLNDHFQGRKHKSKYESLEASKLQAKDTGPLVETPSLGKPQEWTCDLCKVTIASEKMLNDHLQGSKHKSKCESLEASKLQPKDTGPSIETPPFGKPQEWTCDLCKMTTISEKTLNAHLQEIKHKSKCESLGASKLQAKDTGPSTETPPFGKPQEWTCDLCKMTTITEKTLNAHLQESKHKSKCESLKASKLQAKGTGPSPKTPSLGKPQEWTCDLCKVTTTSEKMLNAHLQGSKHKSKCESLEASKLQAKDTRPSPETHFLGKPQEWTCDLCKVTTTSEKMLNDHIQGSKHKSKCESLEVSKLQAKDTGPSAETPPLGKPQAWTYDLCMVTTTSEKMLNAHLQGSKHKSKCESLEASKLQAKDTSPSPETPFLGKPQEWTCDLCKVTTTSEKMLNDHLQGSKHKSKCESLEASKLQAKDTGPSAETPPLGKPQAWTCDLCMVTTTSEKTLTDHFQGSKHKSKFASLKASKLQAKDTGPSPSATGKTNQGKAKLKQDGGANELYCNVCDVKLLSDVDVASHVKGKRHLSNIKEMANLEGVVS